MDFYIEKKWEMSNLKDFSEEQMEEHFKLYSGYVKNLNLIQEKILDKIKNKEFNTPEYNELKRRYGWEYNGVRLHEYYFDNISPNEKIDETSPLFKHICQSFGNFDNFLLDFKKTGAIRGIGWVILYRDNHTGYLFNLWIDDHHSGHQSNGTPILIMDVWEHAYCVDWKPTQRPIYIEKFCNNISWQVVQQRFESAIR